MKNIIKILKTSTTALIMLALMFLVVEPAVSSSASASSQFTETLTVSSEISFITPGSNIVMLPNIQGLTGGTANGQTQVRVLTNNATGYTMTIVASSSLGMVGNTQGGNIPAYVSGSVPDFAFVDATGGTAGKFGFTVEASSTNTADLVAAFKDNGSTTCGGAGSIDTSNACWTGVTTTPVTIVNRSTFTPGSGATTTIKFRASVGSNPNPIIPEDTYTATTTLTATENP